MLRIAIIGAGGFAREVACLIEDLNAVAPRFEVIGFLTGDASKPGRYDSKDKVLGDDDWIENNHDVQALAMAIGEPKRRMQVADKLTSRFPHLEWPPLIHPSVHIDLKSARIERGVIVCAGCAVTVNAVFEEFSLINLHCTIAHEAHIGKGAVVAPSVNISGGVFIGDGAMVGTGAQILPYVTVGAGATVGAGSVVIRDVEPFTTVFGVPAAKIRQSA